MTTKAFQLRGMIAGDIRLSMMSDPAKAGLTAKEWRAEFEARVKAETKGLPGLPHPYLRKVARAVRAERLSRAPERLLTLPGTSQRKRNRRIAARVLWHLRND